MKKLFTIVCILLLTLSSLTACGSNSDDSNKLYVFNWGEYIEPEVLDIFEEETGIEVIYDEFETNESMYSKISAGASLYDLVCPSDYMISKMIAEDLLQPINWDHIPNRVHIGEEH
ncbi:MAG: spermidine/putrescine ABC transporter substrate-binding protein, partial [Lachnospiraceae bacterium]|nr:spermidine/putrescine ABC transporter substrate-binding protein [Lachnospiraceae bacterium]